MKKDKYIEGWLIGNMENDWLTKNEYWKIDSLMYNVQGKNDNLSLKIKIYLTLVACSLINC